MDHTLTPPSHANNATQAATRNCRSHCRPVNHQASFVALLCVALLTFLTVTTSLAANPIDADHKWAWATNAGWVNHRTAHGEVTVHATHLEGYAYAENLGWVRLGTHTDGGSHTYGNTDNTNYGVNRTGNQLSGYAWGANIGWINFNPPHSGGGVTIDPNTGDFSGYAWSAQAGWIKFAGTAQDDTFYKVNVNTDPPTHTVTPSAGDNGTITPSTAQTVNHGATTTFTVTPDAGYSIAGVTGCGGSLVGETYTTGPVTETCEVSATFSLTSYSISPLNDTGVQFCGEAEDGNIAPCTDNEPTGQDAHYGRDAAARGGTLTKVGAGEAGFDFTKISNSGNELPASATLGTGPDDWACTRDNVTGILWEVKMNDASHLRHMDHRYTWYFTNSPDGNPGNAGNTDTCNNTLTGQSCNTENYVARVNAAGLCGHTDWRVPTIKDLHGIANLGRHQPAVDTVFFPNTVSEHFWSGSAQAANSGQSWSIADGHGTRWVFPRNNAYRVQLARGGQVPDPAGRADFCKANFPPFNPDSAYMDHGDGTATDKRTGITWKRCSEGQTWDGSTCIGTASTFTWADALNRAETSTFAGHSDWRVPNIKELSSLVEICRSSGPLINPHVFPGTPTSDSWFWSGTPTSIHTHASWFVDFDIGLSPLWTRTGSLYVRLVRDGQWFGTFGGLTVTIEPAAARDAGAQWRRTGTSTWRDSGTTESDVPTGSHTVEFKIVSGWTPPGNVSVTVNEGQTTTATGTYTAAEIEYTITPSAGLGGSITPDTAQTVNHGAVATFTATADTGYARDDVVGGTCPAGSWDGNVWTTGAIVADCTVMFSFTSLPPTTGSLQVSIEPEEARNVGAQWRRVGKSTWRDHEFMETDVPTGTQTVEFKEVIGYTTPANQSVTILESQITPVTGTYTVISHTVTPSAGDNGTITPSTAQTVYHGATTTFTVTPDAGYTATVGGTCGGTLDGTTYTTGVITGSCEIIASFILSSTFQPFPDTGQTKCYDNSTEITCPQPGQPFYGQDAQYQPRLPRSYTKLGMNGVELPDDALHTDDDGPWMMTRDNVTGLIWEVKTNANKNHTYTWADAESQFIAGLNGSQFGGFSDWRLPSRQEFASLVNWGRLKPAIDVHYFPNTLFGSSSYWSATAYAGNTDHAWRVSFWCGYVGNDPSDNKSNTHYVRAVRFGQ